MHAITNCVIEVDINNVYNQYRYNYGPYLSEHMCVFCLDPEYTVTVAKILLIAVLRYWCTITRGPWTVALWLTTSFSMTRGNLKCPNLPMLRQLHQMSLKWYSPLQGCSYFWLHFHLLPSTTVWVTAYFEKSPSNIKFPQTQITSNTTWSKLSHICFTAALEFNICKLKKSLKINKQLLFWPASASCKKFVRRSFKTVGATTQMTLNISTAIHPPYMFC